MKAFIFLTVAFLFITASNFSQQKVKSKTDDTKVKVKGDDIVNSSVQPDTIQAAELVQLSKTWMDAMMQHDSLKLESLMGAEYNLKKPDGTLAMERAGWMNNLFHNLKIDRFEQSAISANVYGNLAVVTSMYSWAGTMRNSPFDSKGYITDVWAKRNNHWQVISRTALPFPGSNTLQGK